MKVKHLDHLNLSVRDLDESVAWYGRVFGFELVEEDVQQGVRWGVIRSGEAMLCIYEHPERKPQNRWTLADEGRHGVAHFALRIADADEWVSIARREGLRFHYGGEVTWPHSRSWYIEDPTGYEIEVVRWNEGASDFEGRPLGRETAS